MPERNGLPVRAVEINGITSRMDGRAICKIMRAPAPILKVVRQGIGIDGKIGLGVSHDAAKREQQNGQIKLR